MLLERPSRLCRIPGRLVSWEDVKRKLRENSLEEWAKDETIQPCPEENEG